MLAYQLPESLQALRSESHLRSDGPSSGSLPTLQIGQPWKLATRVQGGMIEVPYLVRKYGKEMSVSWQGMGFGTCRLDRSWFFNNGSDPVGVIAYDDEMQVCWKKTTLEEMLMCRIRVMRNGWMPTRENEKRE